MTWQIRIYLVISAIALIVLAYVLPAIHTELVWFIRLVLGAAVVTLIGLLVMGGLMCKEWYLEKRAKRQLEQYATKSGKYRDYQDGFGMLHLLNLDTDIVENLSANPTSHHNGTWQEPPKTAMMAWFALVSRDKQINQQVVQQQLPAPQSLNFFRVMMQPGQVYAFIAGQQVGKTHYADEIASEWIRRGFKPLMVGPKWDIGEWQGCECIGGKENFDEVAKGLESIRILAKSRHEDEQRSHKQHQPQPIFIDDWTLIKYHLKGIAEDLILEASTFYASVQMILYFIIHTDTAHAWGVGKEGAALKNNFVKLFLEPTYNDFGEVIHSHTKGYIVFPSQTIRREIELPSGLSIVPDLIIQPNREDRIIAMIQNGSTDKEIAQEIFGKSYLSGDNFYKVKELREKFS